MYTHMHMNRQPHTLEHLHIRTKGHIYTKIQIDMLKFLRNGKGFTINFGYETQIFIKEKGAVEMIQQVKCLPYCC